MSKRVGHFFLFIFLSVASIGEAWSHTFALGLRAAGDEGGVEMWFRTWHGCNEGPLSEGWIRIEGINVNYPEKIGEATLRSCQPTLWNEPPQFELSTDVGYYCEVDSSGQILGKSSGVNTTAKPSLGFDPKNPITGAAFTQKNSAAVGAILCDTDIQGEAGSSSGAPSEDKWQGSKFVGLEPGLYDIEYMECNDIRAPRNNCANESTPSADFQIQHRLIAALPPVDVTEELAGKPPIQVLPGDESIAITYYAPDDGTVVDHYEYELDESETWTTVAPPDELEPVSTGTLLVKQSNDPPPSGMAHFSRLSFPAMGALLDDRDEVSVKLSHSPSGASSVKWQSKFSVGQRMGFQQGGVFIDGEIKSLIERTSYTEITLIKTRKLDQRTFVEGEITVGRLLPYEDVARTIKVVELNNSKPYKIRFRAVAVDGTAGDFSEIKTETPLPNCEDVTAAGEGLPCQINGVVYEAADLHVLSTTADQAAAGVCGTDAAYTDHKLPALGVILCKQTDDNSTVRAIFDWDNSEPNAALDWLDVVTQMGSRSFGSYNCASRTPSGRCKARLADGYAAFKGMSGAGGDAIKNLDVSDLTDMRDMFKDATAINLDLSAWDISSVDTYDGFDDGADQWCGLGFSNQGRPSDWDAKAQGCLDLNLTTTPEKVVETNDTVIYNVAAFNQTTTDVTSGTLQLVLPTGTQYNAEYTVTQPDVIDGQTLTWNSQNVLEGQRGVELAVVVDVPSSFPGKDMTATATLTDSVSGASVNKVHNVKVGGSPEPLLTLTGPSFVLAGGSLVYDLAYRNSGNRDSLDMTVSLTWDSDTAVVADPSSEDVCSGVPLTCEWTVTVPAGENWFKRVAVTVPADTPMPLTLDATAKAVLPGMRTAVALARTEVDAQPELYIRLGTQPDATVEPNGAIVTETFVKNTGTAVASDVKVSLPLAGTTLQQASAGGSEIDGQVVWSLGSVPGASASLLTATLRAPDPAPDPAQLVQLTARAEAQTPGGRSISEESFAVTVSVTSKPTPELEVAFAPEHYTREAPIDLVFNYKNDSPSEVSGAKLTMLIPKDTNLTATPDGATCYSDRCEKTIGRMASGDAGSAVMNLQVQPDARFSISGGGLLSPTVQGEFLEQTAVAEAYERQASGSNDDFAMSIYPNTGSGCTLGSMESINASNLAGYNLLTQKFLSFTVDGCDPDAPESMTVVIDAGKSLPASALLVKIDESSNQVTPIKDAEISGGVATYTLIDQGELDQDPTAGSLRDPVAFVSRITQFPPDAPGALVATPGDTELLITFDMPRANGSDITHFEYSIDEGDEISTGRDEPAFTVAGLTNGTEYSIRVRAVNGVGKSGWSDPVTGTPEAGTAPPDAPTDLSATILAGDIVISFTPGSDNGAEITDYEAYVDGRGWISTGATGSPAVVRGLPSGATYEISLRGVNAEGKGSISEAIVVTLPPDTDGDGVPDSIDACPTDPSCSALPVPALPWPILVILFGIVGWYGKRFLTTPR